MFRTKCLKSKAKIMNEKYAKCILTLAAFTPFFHVAVNSITIGGGGGYTKMTNLCLGMNSSISGCGAQNFYHSSTHIFKIVS